MFQPTPLNFEFNPLNIKPLRINFMGYLPSAYLLSLANAKATAEHCSEFSEFSSPIKISLELASFLGWDANSEYSRVDVTKALYDYIKRNDLIENKFLFHVMIN